MSYRERKEKASRLRALPLEAVLHWCGAQRDGRDPSKWHTEQGVLSVRGAKFINWSLGAGGGGALDLVMHLKGLAFKPALDWLAHQAGPLLPPAVVQPTRPEPLRLPPPAPSRLGQVLDYLLRERQIPAALLEPLLASGTLYADGRANAVFLLRGPTAVVGAELRGSGGKRWRGLAPGSRKDLGFFSVQAQTPRPLILCESAIDALSCCALHPNHGAISTAGARPNPAWLGSLLQQGRKIWCGFDNDAAGEQMAQAMLALHPAIQRLRPQAHDWNEQLQAQAASPGAESFTTWKEETLNL